MNEQRLIADIEKNALQRLRVSLHKWKGGNYVDIRIFWRKNASDGEAWHPGDKGVRFDVDLLEDLIAGLQEAEKAIERR